MHCRKTKAILLNDPLSVRSLSRQHHWRLRHMVHSTNLNEPSQITDQTAHIQDIVQYHLAPDRWMANNNVLASYLSETLFEGPGHVTLSTTDSAVNFGSQLNFEITLLDELDIAQTAVVLLSQTLLNFIVAAHPCFTRIRLELRTAGCIDCEMWSDDSVSELYAREMALDQFRKLGQKVLCVVASRPRLPPPIFWNLWQRDRLGEYNTLEEGIATDPAEYNQGRLPKQERGGRGFLTVST